MPNGSKKESTSILDLWFKESSRASRLHCLTSISRRRRAGGMEKAKRCSPTASFCFGHTDSNVCHQTESGWISLEGPEKTPYKQNPVLYIYICICMCMCVHCVRFCRGCCTGCCIPGWHLAEPLAEPGSNSQEGESLQLSVQSWFSQKIVLEKMRKHKDG